MDAHDLVSVSALNQWGYCARRCGLIFMDGQFTENAHTMRGSAEHARVDTASYETTGGGARVQFALPVWSDCLGLVGRCDAVEFWPDGAIYPIEYKHGPQRKWLNDDLQLGAQALCLEEMFGRPIPKGAVFHVSSRRRREVNVSIELRNLVERAVVDIRAMLSSEKLPPPINNHRCRECSLREICQPETLTLDERRRSEILHLFDPDAP
uniref:CRISPR-associated exonuclease Cas4 n=1 Tax=mine drainage metagenome TaxID=410659 RepID=E6PG21_9ZZZZ